MNEIQSCFERYEKKYLLTREQYLAVKSGMAAYMKPDGHPRYTICNVYYDTENYDLIRASLEKPVYKEKLRLRSYGTAKDDTTSFIEIKKKFMGVVYKRRISMPYSEAVDYLINHKEPKEKSQISNEIDYFLKYYKGLAPAMVISYDRIAMVGINDPELRITFDTNIRWRADKLSLKEGNAGHEILLPGQHLMELKIAGAMSTELAKMLDELNIRKVSFSKYGRGYLEYMYGQTSEMASKGIVPKKEDKSKIVALRRAV